MVELRDDEPTQRAPLWLLLAVAGLAAARGLEPRRSDRPAGPASSELDLARAPARLLRRLPGIGASRARALVEARWRRAAGDPPLYLRDVPGIGLDVERRVRAWLEGPGAGGSAEPGDRVHSPFERAAVSGSRG